MKLGGDRNQCPACREYFNSSFAFDKHRTGEYSLAAGNFSGRRCLSADEMVSRGFGKNKSGFWVSSKMPARLSGKGKTDVFGEGTTSAVPLL